MATNKVPHLKCLYTNAHSKRKLEALASPRLNIIGISETCGDESSDWNALLDGYRLFKRDKAEEVEGWHCVQQSVRLKGAQSWQWHS